MVHAGLAVEPFSTGPAACEVPSGSTARADKASITGTLFDVPFLFGPHGSTLSAESGIKQSCFPQAFEIGQMQGRGTRAETIMYKVVSKPFLNFFWSLAFV